MIFLKQFGLNRHVSVFSKTNKQQFVVFEKLKSAYLFQTAREKSCDYLLIMYMKKYEIAYHNYVEAKRVHQVQK